MGLLGPPPEVPHVPDPDKLAPADAAPFQGEWKCVEHDFTLRIAGSSATLMQSGVARSFQIGEPVLSIEEVKGKTLRGRQRFTDGNWYPVTAELVNDNMLRFAADGRQWKLDRVP